jgi:hypothetical protein
MSSPHNGSQAINLSVFRACPLMPVDRSFSCGDRDRGIFNIRLNPKNDQYTEKEDKRK